MVGKREKTKWYKKKIHFQYRDHALDALNEPANIVTSLYIYVLHKYKKFNSF